MAKEVENECVVLGRDGSLTLHQARLSIADMEDGSVLLRSMLSEVCGTDVHMKHGRLNTVPYPIIPGHVAVGRVHAVSGVVVDVDGVQIELDDVVTFLNVIDTCNSCLSCLVDKQTTRCPRRRVLGITCTADPSSIRGLLGGWSSFIYLPPRTKVVKLPRCLPPRVLMAAGCSLETALHAVERAGVKLMDRVVVQGSGPVGLLSALLARFSGALQVIVTGAPAHRLEVVEEFGIDATINIEKTSVSDRMKKVLELTEGRLADVVIEATGRPEAVAEGMQFCRDGATYVVVGQYTDNGEVSINPHFSINRKHLTIRGCWGSDFSHFYRGIQFMAKNVHLPWKSVVSGTYELKNAGEALASVQNLTAFKALIRPDSEEP
ncbi:hypothetical protein O6H91_13G055000 [Diphasiastrum complanatum]|uniref:Uncharacterized protein n=1 Tax=Diphasiastrum complanatum TaxID=34168 RepID=A0ACC2BUW5_DIPCM|nr:hypothetical protein O6H91_13G055000 [Diphasiastrum complanatum]